MTAAVLALLVGVSQVPTPTRPRDVWVFRSVLDQRPRMVTLALHEDLWAAYDATHGNLYKVWKGGVNFDGAVYTTSHGPQPTSLGVAYLRQDPDQTPWAWNGRPVEPRYLGYRIDGGGCYLRYRLTLDQRPVVVEERPEWASDGFTRTFRITGLPSGRLTLAAPQERQLVTGERVEGSVAQPDGPGTAYLLSNGVGGINYAFAPPPADGDERAVHGPAVAPEIAPAPSDEPREPGLAMRVYEIAQPMFQLPTLVSGQTPNQSKVVPNVDFPNGGFPPFTDNFLVHLTGYLNPPVAGVYRFRLFSDDGAVLWIRDTKVVDHDGLHSGTSAEGEFTLEPGESPIRIEYFEQGADEMLRLEWKRPGSNEWETVPPSAFTTFSGEVRVTSPGKKNVVNTGQIGRPGDRQPVTGVHPSFELATVRPDDFRPRVGGIAWLPDGRMVICNWEADGGVYVLSGVQGPNPRPTVKRIAKGLAEPLGITTVGKRIFVLQKQELTELIDRDGDDITDEYRAVANGWGVTSNFHEFAFGLVHQNGKFYATLATAINPGGSSTQPQNPDRGKVIEVDEKSGDYRFIAQGLRTPNGIGIGYGGRIYVADNQGDWLPSSKVVEVKEGAFYGSHSVDPVGTAGLKEMLPVVWLPQGEIGNSPSEPARFDVGPYRGQMCHGDVTHGGVKRVFVEEVDGQLQGATFRFTQGLEAGINRISWGPDGVLYVGGIGAAGNWGQEGKERYGLQRLTYNGKPAFEMLSVSARRNGFEVRLTEPLAADSPLDPTYLTVRQWRYVPTAEYGGPKIDEETLAVRSLAVSPDRKTIHARVDGLKAGHVAYLRLDPVLRSAAGRDLWSTEAWYTLNRLPNKALPEPQAASARSVEAGFVPVFDGKTLSGWTGFNREGAPAGWQVKDGALTFVPGAGGGDLRTTEKYGDFDLRFEWKVGPGGNSGVFYRALEGGAPWDTAAEYQILDNERHPDGGSALTSAGSNYALYETDRTAVRDAGLWNEARIVARGTRVEHWLNGRKVVEYDVASADWKDRKAKSKYAGLPNHGQTGPGFIVLQDHGDPVSYRHIRVKRLGSGR